MSLVNILRERHCFQMNNTLLMIKIVGLHSKYLERNNVDSFNGHNYFEIQL